MNQARTSPMARSLPLSCPASTQAKGMGVFAPVLIELPEDIPFAVLGDPHRNGHLLEVPRAMADITGQELAPLLVGQPRVLGLLEVMYHA